MNLKDVANFLGVSVSLVSDIEAGRRQPFDLPRVKLLAKLFKTNEERLLHAAISTRGKFELEALPQSPGKVDIATTLARYWDNLSAEDLDAIHEIGRRAAEREGAKRPSDKTPKENNREHWDA